MIRSRGRASTATAAIFLLVLGACSPEASSPRQNSTDSAVPSRTQAPSTAPSVTSSPSLQQPEEFSYTPSPGGTQLAALAARLTAPDSWLPVTAWAVEAPRAYVADGFRVVSSAEPVGGSPPDVDAIDWPFTTSIADFGEPLAATSQVFVPIGPGTRPLRCAALDANDARSARDAWERAGAKVNDYPDGAFMTVLAWGAAGSGIVLFAQALMPDQFSCGDAY